MQTRPSGSLCPQAAWVFAAITTFLISPASLLAQASLFDSSFAIGSGANGSVYSIVVQNDGKILVGGDFTQIAGQTNLYLARLNPDGQVDQTFAGGTDGAVYRLLQQTDGKILAAGAFTNIQGVVRRGVCRLLTNGIVDLSFDAGGFLGSNHSAFALGLQPDQKILVGTIVQSGGGGLFRLNTNGQIDQSFKQTNFLDQHYIFAITPRTNGSILVGGGFQGVNGFTTPCLALLTTNGVLDTGFTSDIQTNIPRTVSSLVRQVDGSLLVGGSFFRQSSTNRTVIARLTPTLAWDATFFADAFDVNQPTYFPPSPYPHVSVVQVQSDGKYVVGGRFQEVGGYSRWNIVRMDSQGKVDPCFDPGIGLAANGNLGVLALSLQSDGKIIGGGQFFDLTRSPVTTLSSSNLTRLLPQTDCNMTRVHLVRDDAGLDLVFGTCAPGGTNWLQFSTNLIDWTTIDMGPFSPPSNPYLSGSM